MFSAYAHAAPDVQTKVGGIGAGNVAGCGDGSPAASVAVSNVRGLVWYGSTLYFSSYDCHMIKAMLPNDTIITVSTDRAWPACLLWHRPEAPG